ncbi:glycogen/starch synthase [Candidatus Woesearchaeota archaeon]|nr:glycogen/starch synthase [Candidatus Woesearchaeota archaeon]
MRPADYCFEVSWEVCNKVGGIYTVLKTKVPVMKQNYETGYVVVGPYFAGKVRGEFNEKLPTDGLKDVFERLKTEGIICHYGNWLVEGEPDAILIDFATFAARKNEIKRELWDNYKIDSLNTQYFDYDEPVIWAYAAGRFVEEFAKPQPGKKVVAHFHEWLAAPGLLYLHSRKANIATVFTTHATTLGRALTNSNIDIYANIAAISAEQEAYRLGVHAKHQTEAAAARNADVFSTVSDITAMEAEHFLKKAPDVIVHNGLGMEGFPTFEEASVRHRQFKRKIREFITYYFFPYYTFDLEETLYYFLTARYEFHNKGIDAFIRALGELNKALKQEKPGRTVVAFIWVPANIRGIKRELLENRTQYQDIRDSIVDEIEHVKDSMINDVVAQKKITDTDLLSAQTLFELKRKVMKFKKQGSPPLCTHDLYNEESDAILNACKEAGLNNSADDNVKVIFYPIYLSGADGLLDTSYYESMQGAHLGVFPSFYEPWGYTPLEAAALGVGAVTTDLSGFGKYIENHSAQRKFPGVFVVKRLGVQDDLFVKSLSAVLLSFAKYSNDERIKNKIEAKHVSTLADWRFMVKQYIAAHQIAVSKHWK